MLDSDIVFFEAESKRPDDTNGGQITNRVIVSGQVGNLVPPVADADKVSGFVAGYKFYVSAFTPNTDVYYKPWIFISEPPSDEEVQVCLLATGSMFDRWAEARQQLEKYLVVSGRWFGNLYGLQLQNQKSFQIYQRPNSELPAVGEVYALTKNYGTSNAHVQLVRATEVKTVQRTVNVGDRQFTFDFVTVSTAERLDADYDGGGITQYDSGPNYAELRTTRVADAITLYGIKALQLQAEVGANTVQVDALYHQLIPNAQQTTNLPNMDISGKSQGLLNAGNGNYSLTTTAPLSAGQTVYVGSSFFPGTLTVDVSGGSLTDNGRGILLSGEVAVGALDYVEGTVTGLDGSPTYSGSKTFTFAMAGSPTQYVHSTSIGVDAATRRENYVLTLGWVPARGSLQVQYIAGGKVYRIWDRGVGILSGIDTSHGVGQFRWTDNTLQITLVYPPDADTEVLISSGVESTTVNRAGGTMAPPEFRFQCQNSGGLPGSFVVSWNDGTARSISDNGTGTSSNSHGTLIVKYSASPGPLVIVRPTVLPPKNTVFNVAYEHGEPKTYTLANPSLDGSGYVTLQLPDTDIHAGSVEVYYVAGETQYAAFDNAAGHLRDRPTEWIDYALGQVHVHPNQTITKPVASFSLVTTGTLTNTQRIGLGA